MFCEKHQHAFVRVCSECVVEDRTDATRTGEFIYELQVVNGLGHLFTTEVIALTRARAIAEVEDGSTYIVVAARLLRHATYADREAVGGCGPLDQGA